MHNLTVSILLLVTLDDNVLLTKGVKQDDRESQRMDCYGLVVVNAEDSAHGWRR